MSPLSIAPLSLAAGLALGLLVDAIGSSGRINILAPPLLGLLLWNVAVYLLLALGAFGALGPFGRAMPLRGALVRGLRRAPLQRSIDTAQVASALHWSAAAFALGALAAMYLRGIAFEYRAGWETTFLSIDTVRRLLAFVLGPASMLTGLRLPDVQELETLRFARGPGENAARWIHLYAVTLLLFVVLPRAVLALVAARRRAPVASPADTRDAVTVRVLPYSYRIAPELLPALGRTLERSTGRRVTLSVAEPLPLGAEDDIDRVLADAPPALAALFTLSATPEAENHGAFVAALAARARDPLLVLVDESAFVRRFTDAQGPTRRDERRRAWQQVLGAHGVAPQFVDLAA